MGIKENMIQKVIANPGRYSLQQLIQMGQNGTVPMYVIGPLVDERAKEEKQMQMAMSLQEPPVEEMPSVIEQIMQEAQGVAQLPSNLPQEYAGGGVVALAGGGDPEDGPTMDVEGELQRMKYLEMLKRAGARGLDILSIPGRAVVSGIEAVAGIPRAAGVPIPSLVPKELAGSAFPFSEYLNKQEAEAVKAATESGAGPTLFQTGADKDIAENLRQTLADVRGGPGVGAGGQGAGEAGIGAGGIGNIVRQLSEAQKALIPAGLQSNLEFAKSKEAEYRAQQEKLDAERKAEAAAIRGELKGKAYEGLETSLRKEAEQAGMDREQAKAMAIFKAGLAMMSGTSRSALENIGKGAMVGAEDWQKANSELKKAEKERQLMFAHIEQARRAEQRGDIDKRIEELDKANTRKQSMNDHIYSGMIAAHGNDVKSAHEAAKNVIAGATNIIGHQISAGATLGAAKYRSDAAFELAMAKAENRGELTPQLRMQAMKMIDPNEVEAKAIKSLGWEKKPKDAPKLAILEKKKAELYDAELSEILRRAGAGQPMGGQAAAPDYSGFKTLSVQGP